VINRDGKEIKAASAPRCNQAIAPEVADAAAAASRCPVGDGGGECGGGTANSVGSKIHRPIAGKTGSTDSLRTAWFAGFTPNLAAATFIANPDNPKQSIGGHGKVPASVFIYAMNGALAGLPVMNFRSPIGRLVYGTRIRVPTVECLGPSDAKARLRDVGLKARVNSEQVPSKCPAGKVAKTSPAAGGSATKNGVVSIFLSNGKPDPLGKPPIGIPGIPGFPGRR
jgi:membrane peptidoglycan carboxypeptidase